MVTYVNHCFGGFPQILLTFLECLLCSRHGFFDALYQGFLIGNDEELVLSIRMHFAQNTSLHFTSQTSFHERSFGSGKGLSPTLADIQDLVALSKSPGLSESRFSLPHSANSQSLPLTHRVAVNIKVHVNRH